MEVSEDRFESLTVNNCMQNCAQASEEAIARYHPPFREPVANKRSCGLEVSNRSEREVLGQCSSTPAERVTPPLVSFPQRR
jgi:hypothetical protein